MNIRLAKTPWLLKKVFSTYVWNIKTNKKVLYLTFDDGPTPKITKQVLAMLKEYNAKATFFCIGKNVEKHPEIFKRILQDEHIVGNHTYNHLNGWKIDHKSYLENSLTAQEVMVDKSQISNHKSSIANLFRPPYGRIKPNQAKQLQKLGYQIIMWDVLSFDWDKQVSKEKVLKNVLNNTRSGSIIVFHDSEKAAENMLYALPRVMEYFSERGYKFEVLTKEL